MISRHDLGAICCVLGLLLGSSVSVNAYELCDFKSQNKSQDQSRPTLVPFDSSSSAVALNSVQIRDKRIERKIFIEGVYTSRTQTGSVQLVTRLFNCTDYSQRVQLRSIFMDANQAPIEKVSAWQSVFLPPHETGVYREVSISNVGIDYFLIEAQENN